MTNLQENLLTSVISTIIFVFILYFVIKILFMAKSLKRVEKFAMNMPNDNNAYVDQIKNAFFLIVRDISEFLKRFDLMKKYAKVLDGYLIYEDGFLTGMNYIVIKFMILICSCIIYFESVLLGITAFNFYPFLIICLIAFLFFDFIIIFSYHKKKKLIENQLLQAIVIMNSAFKSGKNILGAISIVKNELASPIKEEFEIIYTDLSYGLDVEVCFERFYNRIKIEEAKYIMSSLTLISKTGGNIVNVFNMIEKSFYNRLRIKNELSSLTASSKFLFRILIVLPFIFILVIVCLNPEYFNPLINTKIGMILISIMAILYILYVLLIKKIMKVDEV